MAKRQTKKRKEKAVSYFDYNLLFLVVFLVCFGLVMLYSSSSYLCANSSMYGYDGAFYLKKQLKVKPLLRSIISVKLLQMVK